MKNRTERKILITGGVGFVGCNLAAHLLRNTSAHITVLDNLGRAGVKANLEWLQSLAAPGQLSVIVGDVRDEAIVKQAAQGATEIYHFAAQVAVTNSIHDPMTDCFTNVLGTLHVLEAARASGTPPLVLFTSTNKVYGSLPHVAVEQGTESYSFRDPDFHEGLSEAHPLDFHSPYGCSKGAADQYVHDYARIYGVPTIVFRMSCIAGPRQLGTEDQGWIAHFAYSALEGKPITIYGDGRQVRDILHVHDLVDAMERVTSLKAQTAGQVYNIGGGAAQAISVRQALAAIEQSTGLPVKVEYAPARPGDQQIYVSNTSKLEQETGWQPRRSLQAILNDIIAYWESNLRAGRKSSLAAPQQQLVGSSQGDVA